MKQEKLIELRECVGGPLPEEYEKFLLGQDDIAQIKDVRQSIVWRLRPLMAKVDQDSVLAPVNIGGKILPYILHIRRVLNLAIEFRKGVGLNIVGGGLFSANDVLDCISVGQGNENTLFLRLSDGSVWYFWHASDHVERAAPTLQSWLDACKTAEAATAGNLVPSDRASQIVGYWIPVSSSVLSENLISKKSKYEFLSTFQCFAHDFFGDAISGEWKLVNDDRGVLQLQILDEDGDSVYIVEHLDDDTLVLVGPDGAPFDVTYRRRMN